MTHNGSKAFHFIVIPTCSSLSCQPHTHWASSCKISCAPTCFLAELIHTKDTDFFGNPSARSAAGNSLMFSTSGARGILLHICAWVEIIANLHRFHWPRTCCSECICCIFRSPFPIVLPCRDRFCSVDIWHKLNNSLLCKPCPSSAVAEHDCCGDIRPATSFEICHEKRCSPQPSP